MLQLRRTQELSRLRSDFVASVSHELKTPLTQISLFADTLLSPKERSADDRRHYLTVISREAKRLGQLVDSILHFALMTRGTEACVPRESSALGEEIRAAVAAFEPIAAARGVGINTSIDPEIALPLERDAFRQLMLNVLDNALKFGPDGQTIVASASVEPRTRASSTSTTRARAFPTHERERVFEAFTRADGDGRATGSGIGLAVVRDIVRRHDGTVSMLRLAGRTARASRSRCRTPRRSWTSSCRRRSLTCRRGSSIIEDNKDLALGLRVNFEDRGYQVQVANTARDGLAEAAPTARRSPRARSLAPRRRRARSATPPS